MLIGRSSGSQMQKNKTIIKKDWSEMEYSLCIIQQLQFQEKDLLLALQTPFVSIENSISDETLNHIGDFQSFFELKSENYL
jgi:hypothetical protein